MRRGTDVEARKGQLLADGVVVAINREREI